jgi:hypothetical protein
VKTALLDANLLVLLAVGAVDPSLLQRHKRTQAYIPEDYAILRRFLCRFGKVASTPNAFTEAGNLARQIEEPWRTKVAVALQSLIRGAVEEYVPSAAAAAAPPYLRLGLTDAALVEAVGKGYHLVTADLELYLWVIGHYQSEERATNFNHLRQPNWV